MLINNSVVPNIYMVSGKGGVGKSTVAAALAQTLAQKGHRTLLVEVGQRSFNHYQFGVPVGYSPTSVGERMSLALWGGDSCLREYIGHYIPIRKVVDLFFDNKIMRSFVKVAPGLQELAVLGKLPSGPRGVGPKMEFDSIILDAYSTGHFLSLLRVPKSLAEVIRFGPMGEQSRHIHEVLMNPRLCKIVVVTLAEELPVQESIELVEQIKAEFGQEPEVIGNKFLQSPLEIDELQALRGKVPGRDEFIEFLLMTLNRQNRARERLKGAAINYCELPFIFAEKPLARIERLSREII